MDAARLANTRDVVAQKVHDHQVFGLILLIRFQEHRAGRVFDRVGTARLGAFHRTGLDHPVGIGAEEQLGRAGQDCGQPIRLHQRAVLHRLQPRQRMIKRLRVTLCPTPDREG